MTGTVVPLRQPKAPPTLQELVERVRSLVRDSTDNLGWKSPHTQARMTQRGIGMRQMLETLRKGEGISGPTLDKWGDWRIKLRRKVAGRRVQVVVAVKEKMVEVVTVI